MIGCPAGLAEVTCLVNPCDSAECPANPLARCVTVRCGICHAQFVDEEGRHVNCQTGDGEYTALHCRPLVFGVSLILTKIGVVLANSFSSQF